MNTELEQIKQELAGIKAGSAAAQTETAHLRAENARLCSRLQTVETASRRERRRLRVQAALAFGVLLGAVLLAPANRTAIAQGYGLTLATLNTRVVSLESRMSATEGRVSATESKAQYMSADVVAQSTTFSGCDVVVNNGSGSTSGIVTNAAGQGIGNLIIGYNDVNTDGYVNQGGAVRAGSHNLIVGDLNNYSSYGGIVAGISNTISGPYACVTGGFANTASGRSSSVSGGASNTASGDNSSVSGGVGNTASGDGSSVSGGANITVSRDEGWAAGKYHTP